MVMYLMLTQGLYSHNVSVRAAQGNRRSGRRRGSRRGWRGSNRAARDAAFRREIGASRGHVLLSGDPEPPPGVDARSRAPADKKPRLISYRVIGQA